MSVTGKYISIGQDEFPTDPLRLDGGIAGPPGIDCDAELLPLMAMTQMFSQVNDAHELFRLAALFTTDTSIGADDHAIAVVSNHGLPAGSYRVTRRFVSMPHRRTTVEVESEDEELAVHSGGIAGSVLRKTKPELITHLTMAAHDPLGSDFLQFDSMLILPLFSRGRVLKRALFFRRAWSEVELDFVSRSLLIMNLVETAIERLAQAAELASANRELDRQFENISRIQRRLIPRFDPERACRWADGGPHQERLDIGMSYRTAGRAGGDYFDFFPVSDSLLGVIVADVSGHGADAAMFMAVLRTLVHQGAPWMMGSAAVIRWIHRRLVPLMPNDRFITACVLIVDTSSGRLDFSCAGHPAPALRRADGTTKQLEGGSGCFMSPAFEESDAQTGLETLHRGDTLLLFTDGLPESVPGGAPEGKQGIDRVLEALRDCNNDAASTVQALDEAAATWRSSPDPWDDMTLVVFRRL